MPGAPCVPAACSGAGVDFLKERGVDYAAGKDRDTAEDEATLRWLREQAPDRKDGHAYDVACEDYH